MTHRTPSPAPPLRSWQRAALEEWMAERPRDYLAVATPGAGKTAFALRIPAELLAAKHVRAITVVAPTEHLKQQWADAATRLGVRLDPRFTNAQGATGQAFDGVVVTYAQVASHPMLHRARTENRKTLVILDEIHHAGDAMSWGSAVREAFEPAAHRLALTGTPFRSDVNAIPFVRYEPDGDGSPRSSVRMSARTPRRRPFGPLWTRRASGLPRSWPRLTAGSARCVAPCRTPQVW